MSQVEEYVQGTLGGDAYIAVHLRIGVDWVSERDGTNVFDFEKGALITYKMSSCFFFPCMLANSSLTSVRV